MVAGKKAARLKVSYFNGISYENPLFSAFVHELQTLISSLLGAVGIFLMMQHPWIDMNTANWFSECKIQLSYQGKNCTNVCLF